MTMLRVAIHDPRTGMDEEAFFAQSPVRIGRNALNDLLLDEPSVSQWHGQLVFGEHGIEFVDVGSSNGTRVSGAPALANQTVPIALDSVIELGPLLLRAEQVDARGARARGLGARVSEDVLTILTTIDVGLAASDEAESDDTNAGPVPPDTAVASSAISQLQYLHAILEVIGPLRAAYVEAVAEQVDALPSASRSKLVPQLVRELPELGHMAEIGELAERHRISLDGPRREHATASEWLEKLAGAPLRGPQGESIAEARALARVAVLLQTFARSLFELRRAKQEAARGLGLGGADESWPRSGDDILAWLLDFRADGEDRVSGLMREFADLAVHQMALVAAMREGARALVEEMSPHATEQQLARTRSREGGLRALLPTTDHSRWAAFRARFADLVDGERFLRTAFGARFGRAYLATVGHAPPAAPRPAVPTPRAIAPTLAIPMTR